MSMRYLCMHMCSVCLSARMVVGEPEGNFAESIAYYTLFDLVFMQYEDFFPFLFVISNLSLILANCMMCNFEFFTLWQW